MGNGYSYDPQADLKKQIVLSVRDQLPKKPFEDPLGINFEFSYAFPKSWSKALIRARKELNYPRTARPDLDNLCKWFDLFNGLVWIDDSQICEMHAKKFYGPEFFTRIQLYSF